MNIENVKCDRICDKAEGCTSSCSHKKEHTLIYECTKPCPINASAICIETHPTTSNP